MKVVSMGRSAGKTTRYNKWLKSEIAKLQKENLLKKKQTPEGKALETLSKAFARDTDYRHSWVANIAMVIYDKWPAKGRKIDKCNLCAEKIMDFIFKEQP